MGFVFSLQLYNGLIVAKQRAYVPGIQFLTHCSFQNLSRDNSRNDVVAFGLSVMSIFPEGDIITTWWSTSMKRGETLFSLNVFVIQPLLIYLYCSDDRIIFN